MQVIGIEQRLQPTAVRHDVVDVLRSGDVTAGEAMDAQWVLSEMRGAKRMPRAVIASFRGGERARFQDRLPGEGRNAMRGLFVSFG